MERERVHAPAPVAAPPAGSVAEVAPTDQSAEPADGSEPGDAPAEPESEQTEAQEALPTPADIAEEEQAALWGDQRARAWYQRRSLRALFVIAVLIGLSAIIPYPLRITSECVIIPAER